MFVEPDYASSADYREFWEKLGRGEYQAAEYKRIGKGGKEVWIQASYNPIFDLTGKPYKVVKYATDITGRKAAVNMIGAGLAKLAEGDLTARIDTHFVGELDEVRVAFNDTVEKFSDIVEQLRTTSSALKIGDRRNPRRRQRSCRAHHQAGGGDRRDLGGDGAAGDDRRRQCQAGRIGERQGAGRVDHRRADRRGHAGSPTRRWNGFPLRRRRSPTSSA